MKVLQVGPSPQAKGGISSFIANLLPSLEASQVPYIFLSTYLDGFYFSTYLRSIIGFLGLLPSFSILHIHSASRGSFYRKSFFVLISKLFGKKVILHYHGGALESFYNKSPGLLQRYISFVLRLPDRVLVLGPQWLGVLNKICPSARGQVLTHFVPSYLSPGVGKESNRILFLGRIEKSKGVYDLLQAFVELQAVQETMNWTLTVAGEGGEEQRVRERFGHFNNIEFRSWVSDQKKREILSRADIIVVPSYREALGLVILEAYSTGTAVIASDVGGIPHIVKHGFNGFLFPPGDIQQLAEYLRLLCSDRGLLTSIQQNNLSVYHKLYHGQRYMSKLKQLYADMDYESG